MVQLLGRTRVVSAELGVWSSVADVVHAHGNRGVLNLDQTRVQVGTREFEHGVDGLLGAHDPERFMVNSIFWKSKYHRRTRNHSGDARIHSATNETILENRPSSNIPTRTVSSLGHLRDVLELVVLDFELDNNEPVLARFVLHGSGD